MKISCVLAGYNESDIIATSIERCLSVFEKDFEDFELILVDDGSSDKTADIMSSYADNDTRVRFLPNYVNLNFGASCLRGISAARFEFITIMAADLPYPPEDLSTAVIAAQQHDLLVLERVGYKPRAFRQLTSSVNRLLYCILFPKLIRGTRVLNYSLIVRQDVAKHIAPLARSPIFWLAEMIFRAKLLKLRVGHVDARCIINKSRSGAFGHPHDIIWGIYDMLRFRVRLWLNKM